MKKLILFAAITFLLNPLSAFAQTLPFNPAPPLTRITGFVVVSEAPGESFQGNEARLVHTIHLTNPKIEMIFDKVLEKAYWDRVIETSA